MYGFVFRTFERNVNFKLKNIKNIFLSKPYDLFINGVRRTVLKIHG